MRLLNLRTAALALVAGIGLSGCAYGPYGGLGVGVGYGNNGYYDPYYGGYGSPYGYGANYGYGYGSPYGYGYGSPFGYGSSYYGWNNGFYYPGTGYYVYDRYRRPYRWSDDQRRYWEGRRDAARKNGMTRIIESWGRFEDGSSAATTRSVRQRGVRDSVSQQQVLSQRQRTFSQREQARSERQQARSERRSARSEAREERGERRRFKVD